MFEHLFFIYLNCFLRIIIFLLFYYVVSLSYPCPSFLEFVVSPCPRVPPCRIPVAVSVSMLPRPLLPATEKTTALNPDPSPTGGQHSWTITTPLPIKDFFSTITTIFLLQSSSTLFQKQFSKTMVLHISISKILSF